MWLVKTDSAEILTKLKNQSYITLSREANSKMSISAVKQKVTNKICLTSDHLLPIETCPWKKTPYDVEIPSLLQENFYSFNA